MAATTTGLGSGPFTDMISSIDRRCEFVENQAGANVRVNNFLTPTTLDNKSSILNAPCGYSNGVYASLRPVQTFGSELVTNGDFATDSNWFKDANWTIANGKAASTGLGRMFQSISFLESNIGTKVKISFDITEITSGGVVVNCYGGISELFTSVGTHTFITTTTNTTNLYFNNAGAGGGFIGSIDNVSVKEVIDADFDFTRGSSATRVNEQGLIEEVGNNIPRIDYTDSSEGVLLLENSATNLNTFSDPTDAQKGSTSYASVTFQDNFNWGLGNVINNAIVFVDNSTTRYAYYNSSVTSGTEYTLSVFIKMDDNSIPIPATDFLMVLAGTSFASGYNVESYGNNVYRVSVSGTAGASNTANGILKIASHSTKGFKISAFQLEVGSYATSLINTNGSAVTRLADVCNNAGSSDLINSTEGVLYTEFSCIANDGETRIISLSEDGNTNNRINIFQTSGSNKIKFTIRVNGTNVFNETVTLSNILNYNKFALSYKENGFKIYINGVKEEEQLSGSIYPANTLDKLNFDQGGGVFDFYGNVKSVAVFKEALTDEELTCLTS